MVGVQSSGRPEGRSPGLPELFYVTGKCSCYIKKKLRAGCALRAKELWLLKQPRSGARVRLAGLFILQHTLIVII